MKGAANLFGKDVSDTPSEAVVLSWTASLIRHIEVSMFYHRQHAKLPLAGVNNI